MAEKAKVFYDKKGIEVHEFDVVKVFHFVGARGKHHYMYKWIRKDDAGNLCLQHLTDNQSSLVRLSAVCSHDTGSWTWEHGEIVQSNYE